MTELKMAFTGVKEGNMSFSHGDCLSVINNRLAVALREGFGLFGRRGMKLVPHGFSPELVHGDGITIVKESEREKYDGVGIAKKSSIRADAVITNLKNFPVLFPNADCFPVVLHCIERDVLAVIHSGRNGTLKNITGAAASSMWAEFGCQPKNIRAYIFPGICADCYVHHALSVFVPRYLQDCITKNLAGVSFDLRRMILRQLKKAGIEHIVFPTGGYNLECTCHTRNGDAAKYFSAFGFDKQIPGHEIRGNNAIFVEMSEV